MYFSGKDVEIDVIVGKHAGEPLDDPSHLKARNSGFSRR
jgi:hypothetical protein